MEKTLRIEYPIGSGKFYDYSKELDDRVDEFKWHPDPVFRPLFCQLDSAPSTDGYEKYLKGVRRNKEIREFMKGRLLRWVAKRHWHIDENHVPFKRGVVRSASVTDEMITTVGNHHMICVEILMENWRTSKWISADNYINELSINVDFITTIK